MKKTYRTISLPHAIEDKIQSLRIYGTIELTYAQIIEQLVKEALKARGLIE